MTVCVPLGVTNVSRAVPGGACAACLSTARAAQSREFDGQAVGAAQRRPSATARIPERRFQVRAAWVELCARGEEANRWIGKKRIFQGQPTPTHQPRLLSANKDS